jgi:hypothetical protein
MIPGMSSIIGAIGSAPSGGGGAGGSLTIAALTSATSSGSKYISIPSAAIAGDFAVLVDVAADFGDSIASVTPSGWTSLSAQFVSAGTTSIRTNISYRKLTSGNPGSTVTGLDVYSSRMRKVMLVFRPSTSIVSINAPTWNAEATSGNPASQTVTVSGVATPLIVLACASAVGSVPAFSTETPAMTNITYSSNNAKVRIGYTIYNSSPSNQSIDMNDVDVNILQSGSVRFT